MSWDYLDKINWIPFSKDQKRLTEFLYSILALCFMIWSIVFVQVNNTGIIDTSFQNNSSIPLLTKEQIEKALIDSITPNVLSKNTSLSDKESKDLIDSITPKKQKTSKNINN